MMRLGFVKVMQLMLVVSCLSCYLLLRQAMSENRTHVIEGPRPAAKHAHTLVQNLQMVNFSSQITRTCPFEDTLNIPPPLIRDATSCANCSRVTCRALLAGNDSALYEEAREFMTKHKRPIPPDAYLFDLASDCDKFKRVMGYHLKPASSEEANFSIAFNMLIHTDTEQVERLLRAIYAPQNSYCVHIDTKSEPSMQKTVRAIVGCFDNVFVASKLERVVYAGFSRLQADINCMRDQVSRPTRWRYLLNIAGQAFPLRTNLELVRILKLYNGYNDIESLYRRTLRKRIDAEWRETKDDKMELTGRKNPPPPHNIEIVRGSAYGVFSRRFVEFVVTDEKAKDLLEWSRSTFSPDEHYWSTLHHTYVNPHLNTPGGFSGRPDKKPWLAVFAAWGGRDKCHGMWQHGSCVFGVEDLPILIGRRELFVNKLYTSHESLALTCLESWLKYKERCPPEVDYGFYAKLPFTQNAS